MLLFTFPIVFFGFYFVIAWLNVICVNKSSLQSEITLKPIHDGYRAADTLYFKNISVFGQMSTPSAVLVNGKEIPTSDYEYDADIKVGLFSLRTGQNWMLSFYSQQNPVVIIVLQAHYSILSKLANIYFKIYHLLFFVKHNSSCIYHFIFDCV